MTQKEAPPETPIPVRYRSASSHSCRYPDTEVLLEDVRQSRKRRWWIGAFAITAFCGSILTVFLLIFNTGQAVGATRYDITQIKSQQIDAKVDRERLHRVQVEAARATNERYERINSTLIRLEIQLKTLVERVDYDRGRRRGR